MRPPEPSLTARLFAWVPFVASAALVAFALHLIWTEPVMGALLVATAAVVFVPTIAQRWKMRRLLKSGDVEAILTTWQGSLRRLPNPETMTPLIRATAFAAHGYAERARRALARAERGPAWDAALEHRLVIETLLEVFDGQWDVALDRAHALGRLPLPPSPLLRARVSQLRAAMTAFARAFAHRTESGDVEALAQAARNNPLVHWPLRYAAAVACIDRGEPHAATRLLDRAPEWPDDSVFHAFHEEIAQRARTEAS